MHTNNSARANTHRLFVYGTLQVSQIQQQLLGRHFKSPVQAVLQNYQCFLVQDQLFPAAVQRLGSHLQGCLLQGVTQDELELLDDYEGECYQRIVVTIEQQPAWCYCLKDDHRDLLSDQPWSLDDFITQHLAYYSLS